MPYIRFFDEDRGSRELVLAMPRLLIGRDPKWCDLVFSERTVSRLHALLLQDTNGFLVQDAGSRDGTKVNGAAVQRHHLKHEDVIQLGEVVLEYRTDDEHAAENASHHVTDEHERNMRLKFRLMPRGIGLRVRFVHALPSALFSQGDTVRIADGGVLLPGIEVPSDDIGILELELTWPDKRRKTLFGEIISAIDLEGDDAPAFCLKLHHLPSERREQVLEKTHRDSWQVINDLPIALE